MSVIAITGSASGIGAALSEVLRENGHSVIGIDRSRAEIEADLSTAQGREEAVAAVLERCGGVLDGLFDALSRGRHPAAVVVGSVAATQPGVGAQPMVKAMLDGDEALAMELAEQDGQTHLAYASSKYAVTCLARRKAVEWARRGVRLNVVAPGAVETPLLQASKDDPRYGESTRRFVAPLGRNSEPAEVAEVIAFLLSEKSSFIQGSVLFVDGGMDALVRPDVF